jgi:hypothetical protein
MDPKGPGLKLKNNKKKFLRNSVIFIKLGDKIGCLLKEEAAVLI